jgi:hypothetical protein
MLRHISIKITRTDRATGRHPWSWRCAAASGRVAINGRRPVSTEQQKQHTAGTARIENGRPEAGRRRGRTRPEPHRARQVQVQCNAAARMQHRTCPSIFARAVLIVTSLVIVHFASDACNRSNSQYIFLFFKRAKVIY